MGNCMQSCKNGQKEEINQEDEEASSSSSTRKGTFVKESGFEKGSLKVKIMLTKQELQWLMLQLKDNEGKGLEAYLGEIGKGINNKRVGAWKPSLESILECPEAIEMDRS